MWQILLEKFVGGEVKHPANIDCLDKRQKSLARFVLADKGLVFPECRGKCGLCKATVSAPLAE